MSLYMFKYEHEEILNDTILKS